jgi:hypothetical protein
MKNNKQIGVWMDHSRAQVMPLTGNTISTIQIDSSFDHEKKITALTKSEHIMHNKENHEQAGYYDKISKALEGYHEILLFGPTDAKNELGNIIKNDQRFAESLIDIKSSDKLSENEMQLFTKKHFQII